MATAAVLGLGIVQAPSRPFALYIDGQDVLTAPGSDTMHVGTPVESITVTEAGPGGVSTMDFTYEDPAGVLGAPQPGATVEMWDRTNNAPLFVGTLNRYDMTAFTAALGRSFNLSATGIEAVLDWKIVVGDLSGGAVIPTPARLISQYGFGFTDLACTISSTVPDGDATDPIGRLIDTAIYSTTATYTSPVIDVSGTSLRSAIATIALYSTKTGLTFGTYPLGPLAVTVDFYHRLRVFRPEGVPADWTTLTVNDSPGGAIVASGLHYESSPGDIYHEVYLKGVNAAATGYFSDGSGIKGPQASLSDSLADTADKAAQVAGSFLSNQGTGVRGSFDILQFTPVSTVHAGGVLSLTDPMLGIATTYTIGQIVKTFYGNGTQDWHVQFGSSFGNRMPSAMAEMGRKLRTVDSAKS